MSNGLNLIRQDAEDKSTFERLAYLIEKHAPKLMKDGEYLTPAMQRRMERKKDIVRNGYGLKRN